MKKNVAGAIKVMADVETAASSADADFPRGGIIILRGKMKGDAHD